MNGGGDRCGDVKLSSPSAESLVDGLEIKEVDYDIIVSLYYITKAESGLQLSFINNIKGRTSRYIFGLN